MTTLRALLAWPKAVTVRAGLRWPSQCRVCRSWPAEPLCEACVARFAQPVSRCRTCALAVPAGVAQCGQCLREPPPLDACLAAVSYGYPWAALLSDFKFHGQPGHAAALAALLARAPGVGPALRACELLLPMPLAPRRLRERGFNQALLLARQLEPGRTEARLLLRLRDTRPQSELDRRGRQRNVRGVYALDPLQARRVSGRRVVLLDDVMTSGASLHAAALVLREAGVGHVTGLVLARTAES